MNRLSYHLKLHQLHRREKQLAQLFKPDIEMAIRHNDYAAQKEVEAQLRFESEEYIEKIALLETQYIASLADRHLIRLPDHPIGQDDNDSWYMSRWTCRLTLLPDAQRQLLVQIRQSRKERRSEYTSWIAALTGLIGAVIGLLTVVLRSG